MGASKNTCAVLMKRTNKACFSSLISLLSALEPNGIHRTTIAIFEEISIRTKPMC